VLKHPALPLTPGKDVVVGMRPEHLSAAPPDYTGPVLAGDVDPVELLGLELVVHFTIDANRVLAEGAVDHDEATAIKHGEGVARPGRAQYPGQAWRQAAHGRQPRGHVFLRPADGTGHPKLRQEGPARRRMSEMRVPPDVVANTGGHPLPLQVGPWGP
jgi:TOBE domain